MLTQGEADAIRLTDPADKQRTAIETAAQTMLYARQRKTDQAPETNLALPCNPLTTPPEPVRAHQKLDRAADAARLALLFAQLPASGGPPAAFHES